MAFQRVDIEDIKRIVRQAAGQSEDVDFDSDISQERFADMGYDSIALLEVGSLIEQEYDISLDDFTVAEAETPAELLAAVNVRLGAENSAA